VEDKFPGRWQGPFQVGAQGVRFWCHDATNTTGAWIRETGVFAFTGEGRFLPWGEVLGQDFIRNYEQNRIGGAIDGTHFDGKTYWCKKPTPAGDVFIDMNTEVLKRKLGEGDLPAAPTAPGETRH
jgi:hypothetical protein